MAPESISSRWNVGEAKVDVECQAQGIHLKFSMFVLCCCLICHRAAIMALLDMVCLGAAIVTSIALTQLCPICSLTLLLGIGRQYFLYMHSSDACNHCSDGVLALGKILKSDPCFVIHYTCCL